MATKEPLQARVYDPEMDMNRTVEFHSRVKVLLVVAAALRWLAPRLCRIETPRRSVDRELGQSPLPLGVKPPSAKAASSQPCGSTSSQGQCGFTASRAQTKTSVCATTVLARCGAETKRVGSINYWTGEVVLARKSVPKVAVPDELRILLGLKSAVQPNVSCEFEVSDLNVETVADRARRPRDTSFVLTEDYKKITVPTCRSAIIAIPSLVSSASGSSARTSAGKRCEKSFPIARQQMNAIARLQCDRPIAVELQFIFPFKSRRNISHSQTRHRLDEPTDRSFRPTFSTCEPLSTSLHLHFLLPLLMSSRKRLLRLISAGVRP